MLTVAIHQPNHIPWLGFFRKMAHADVFVLLDHVQFSRESYTHRVRIAGPRWLTVPVTHAFGQTIDQTRVARPDFHLSHEGILRAAYKKSPTVEEYLSVLRAGDTDVLLDVNLRGIDWLRQQLGVSTPMILSSSLEVTGTSTNALVEIVAALGGSAYVAGAGAVNYQEDELFERRGIAVQRIRAISTSEDLHAVTGGLSTLDTLATIGVTEASRLAHA